MSRGRRRRVPRPRGRERRAEQPRERPPEEDVSAKAAGVPPQRPGGSGEPVPAEAAGAGRSRAARPRARHADSLGERVGRVRVSPWLIATPIVATVIVVLAVLILS